MQLLGAGLGYPGKQNQRRIAETNTFTTADQQWMDRLTRRV